METTPITTVLALALLTAPALAGGVSAATDDSPSVWRPTDKLLSRTPEAHLGSAVSVLGDLVVAGSPGTQELLVYEQDDHGWSHETTLAPSEGGASGFGSAVAIDESKSTIVVGAGIESEVYVYERNSDGWSQAAVLSDPDASCLGLSVDVEENTVVAGAPCSADEVLVFERGQDGGWTIAEALTGTGSTFGYSIAIDGSSLAASDLGETVQLFTVRDGSWEHQATVSSSAPQTFGASLDLDRGVLAVGDPGAYPTPAGTGSVHLFEREAETWSASTTLVPSDVSPFERQSQVDFGSSVALEDGRLAVGAPGDDRVPGVSSQPAEDEPDPVCWEVPLDATCQYPGAVYMFEREQSTWRQEAKVQAPDALPTEPPRTSLWMARTDAFGAAVDLTPGKVAVGAPFADLAPGDDGGAAYLYAHAVGGGT